jgi:post-segregation antitoxin (ccd killing protein)
MNISLPDELKARMDKHKVNWSALASEAFRREVDNVEYLASIRSNVKRRIAETEIEDIGGVEKYAHRNGQYWAEEHARALELRRLDAYVQQHGGEFESWDLLVRVISGDSVHEYRDDWYGPASQFGRDVVAAYEEQYATAFAEGALKVLDEADKAE